MSESIRVFAPASVGNAGVGFDVLGFAVNEPGDELMLRKCSSPGVTIREITGDEGKLTMDPLRNTATIAINDFLNKADIDTGVEVHLHKKMPFGSGLGSSAASAVAGAFAVNHLFDSPFSIEEVLACAMEGEFFASGAHHADNVAPCLYGGMVLIRSNNPYDVVPIPTPKDVFITLIYPKVEIKTVEARSILPYEIPLKTASKQWANIAGFVAGLMSTDYDLIKRSFQDYVAEPYRSKLIPGFHEVKKIALDQGALGFCISGSGPTMFAFTNQRDIADQCASEISHYYKKQSIEHLTFVSPINQQGPRILD